MNHFQTLSQTLFFLIKIVSTGYNRTSSAQRWKETNGQSERFDEGICCMVSLNFGGQLITVLLLCTPSMTADFFQQENKWELIPSPRDSEKALCFFRSYLQRLEHIFQRFLGIRRPCLRILHYLAVRRHHVVEVLYGKLRIQR